jgi:hypothetical protein
MYDSSQNQKCERGKPFQDVCQTFVKEQKKKSEKLKDCDASREESRWINDFS